MPEEPKTQTGTVKVSDVLCIREGPGTGYKVVGYLRNGNKVTILEKQTAGTMIWGKISKGWISLDYVELDGATAKPQTKTVTADCLRVRSAAGTSNRIVAYLYAGAKVEILETTKVGGATWGKISKGWISMDYVK